ncbi:MAG: alpha/beta hydrolase [Lachnospiraceae bacterium]|nr:alpha/beta hydrolase [Lachnospiraceae bacterium]
MAKFTFEDKQIYYETHGEGAPLLLLNGIMMSCASWREFVPPLSAQNRLIMVDMIDQGRSDKYPAPYNHEIQLRLIHALLDHLGVDRVHIAGISYGSEIGLEYAILHPERVERLMLFNATAATGPWLGDIGKAWNLAADSGEAYYYTAIPVIYSPQFYMKQRDWMEQRKKQLIPIFESEEFIEAMKRLTVSSDDYDVRERLGEVRCPTLIVSARFDYLTPVEEQRYLADHIPDSHYVMIEDSGHASMYEQPMLFAALVTGFANTTKDKYGIT